MKCFSVLSMLLLTAGCGVAQTSAPIYEWKATLKAIDESGNPIGAAKAQIGYFANSQPVNAEGITDTNGIFFASHSALSTLVEVSCQANKDGYYPTWVRRDLGPKYDPAQWVFTQTLVLKKIGKPIPMFAKSVDSNPPVLGEPVGYDLMKGDWVAPHGQGVSADIIFQKTSYRKSGTDYEYKVVVTFPKSGDGIQSYAVPEAEAGSSLRSPHEAPLEGYQQELTKERSAHPGQPAKNDYDSNTIYFFRVRTIKDQDGKIVSAFYGKIYGDFMQFNYYLNPTPNDRNIEFDPKQNLVGGLTSLEEVSAP